MKNSTPRMNHREICKNCGCTLGSHLSYGYTSTFYGRFFPTNYCPGHEGRMDWDKGPGTVFEPSGRYKEDNNQRHPEIVNAPKHFRKSFGKCAEDKWASGIVQGMPEDGDTIL